MTTKPNSIPEKSAQDSITFIKGTEPLKLQSSSSAQAAKGDELIVKIRENLAEAMNAKHVALVNLGVVFSMLQNSIQFNHYPL